MLTPQLSAHFPRRYNKCVSAAASSRLAPREPPCDHAQHGAHSPPTGNRRLSMHARAASQSRCARYGARSPLDACKGRLSVPRRPGRRPKCASGGRPRWTAAGRGSCWTGRRRVGRRRVGRRRVGRSCWTGRRRRGALAGDVLIAPLGPWELGIDEVPPALDGVPVL